MLQHHKAYLHSSYEWCTIFLISVLYKIPFFCVVQNSCFLWCTILLKNGMMYLIPVWHVVPSSVVGKSFFSNFECCTIFWCIQVCVPTILLLNRRWSGFTWSDRVSERVIFASVCGGRDRGSGFFQPIAKVRRKSVHRPELTLRHSDDACRDFMSTWGNVTEADTMTWRATDIETTHCIDFAEGQDSTNHLVN